VLTYIRQCHVKYRNSGNLVIVNRPTDLQPTFNEPIYNRPLMNPSTTHL